MHGFGKSPQVSDLGIRARCLERHRLVETALALVPGDLTKGALLLCIHSQCFTGEVLRSRIETRINNERRKYD